MYTLVNLKNSNSIVDKIDGHFGTLGQSSPLCYRPNIISNMSVITPSSFDVSKLSVSEVKKLDNGSSQVYLNYDGRKLRVQAPRMPLPLDASDYQGNQKYKAQFSFKERTTSAKVAAYYSVLEQIDAFVVAQATKNAGKWFKMPGASRDTIALFYTPSVKIAKDKEGNPKDYPPTQSVALKMRNGVFDAELYDDKKRLLEGVTPLEVLRRGAEATFITDCTGIWIADKKFGTTWKLHQARIDVAATTQAGCAILDDDEDGVVVAGAGVSAQEEDAELLAAVLPPKSAPADDEDEDEEDDVEADEVVQPVPVPKKAAAPVAAPAPAVRKVVKKATKA